MIYIVTVPPFCTCWNSDYIVQSAILAHLSHGLIVGFYDHLSLASQQFALNI